MSIQLPVVAQQLVDPKDGRINRAWYLALLNLTNTVTAALVSSVNISGNNGITVAGSPITSAGVITLGINNLTCANAQITGTVTSANVIATVLVQSVTVSCATVVATNAQIGQTASAVGIVATGRIEPASTFGILGTATNDNANAGSFGEFISAKITSGPAISLSTGTTANVTAIGLTSGDWDIDGTVSFLFQNSTNFTNLIGGSSVTVATLQGNETYFDYETPAIGPTSSFHHTWVIPHRRLLLSSSTTCNLVAQGTFSGGTLLAFGEIMARRMR